MSLRLAGCGLALAFCLGPVLAEVETGVPVRLPECFTALAGFQGDFRQTLLDEQGKELQSHRGRVENLRPGRLRWEILAPYNELLLSDGQKLLHYQPDLEQLQEYPLQNSPLLQLLDGLSPASAGHVQLEALADQDGLKRYRVHWSQADATREYEFNLRGCLPHSIRWRDELGQSVSVLLEGLQETPPAPERFQFVPPPVDDPFLFAPPLVPAGAADGG